MDLYECQTCANSYQLDSDYVYQCECELNISEFQCEKCNEINTFQFNPIDSFNQAIKCNSCSSLHYINPCLNCLKLNTSLDNKQPLKCKKCSFYTFPSKCPSCQLTYGYTSDKQRDNCNVMVKCPFKECPPYIRMKCDLCNNINCMDNFKNPCAIKCQFCNKTFYSLFCIKCKNTTQVNQKDFGSKVRSLKKCDCGAMIQLNKAIDVKFYQQSSLIYGKKLEPIDLEKYFEQIMSNVQGGLNKIEQQQEQQYDDKPAFSSPALEQKEYRTKKPVTIDLMNMEHCEIFDKKFEEDIIDNYDCQKCGVLLNNSNNRNRIKIVLCIPVGIAICVLSVLVREKSVIFVKRLLKISLQTHLEEIWKMMMLNQIQDLHQKGYYRRAFELVSDLAYSLKEIDNNFILFSKCETSIEWISEFYCEYGALALKMSVLEIAKKCVLCCYHYLTTHPNQRLLIQNTLTYQRINFWLCRYVDSIKILQQLLTMIPEDLINQRIEIYNQIGNAQRAWCLYSEAEENISVAEELMKNQKDNQLLKSNVYFMKARLYMDTDRSQQGVDIAIECLDIRRMYYQYINDEHPEIAVAEELVAKIYFSQGKITQAQQHHEVAYALKTKIFGIYNFETIDSINERGRLQLSMKKEKDAMFNFALIGEISQLLLGPCNQYEALSHNNLGCALFNQSQYEESISQHTKALKVYETLWGNEHQKLFFSLNQMAQANKNLNRLKVAKYLWERCVDILEKNNKVLNQKQVQSVKNAIQQINSQYED